MPDALQRLTTLELERMRERHLAPPTPYTHCWYCGRGWPWPCDAARLLATCDALEARGKGAEVALRRIADFEGESMEDPDAYYRSGSKAALSLCAGIARQALEGGQA